MDDNIVTVARETIRTAEKFHGIETAHPALLLFARAIVQQDEEIRQLKDMAQIVGQCDSKKINAQIGEINALKDRLAALREKHRWHKQSEEPAPKTYEKVIWIREEEYDCGGIFEWNGSVCCGKCVPFDCYWRPLDLPEEEK